MPNRIIKKTSITNEEKLNDLLNYTDDVNGCYIWKGAVNTDGYAHMLGNIKVHRFVKKLQGIDIEGLVVRHICDNPLCIKPDHLIPGTNKENVQDRVDRGRTYKVITEEIVSRVKSLLTLNFMTNRQISVIVGIDERRVSDIKRNLYSDDGKLIPR